MAILLLFNNQDLIAYSEIRENTQLNEKELNKTVQSLIDVKMLEQSEQVRFNIKADNPNSHRWLSTSVNW